MNKKGLEFEVLVKVILALVVLVVVIAVFYALFRPTINSMLGIRDEGAKEGGNILDDLFRAFGRKCEDGKVECNPVSNQKRTCEAGEWKTTDEACD
ncbi:MAG: hypothetical protein ABIJ34_00615 [archaeon]